MNTIFDAFMYITIGSFLPDVLEKFAQFRNKGQVTQDTPQDKPQE